MSFFTPGTAKKIRTYPRFTHFDIVLQIVEITRKHNIMNKIIYNQFNKFNESHFMIRAEAFLMILLH